MPSKKPSIPEAHYQIGDIVFFSTSNHTIAGEAMFIGRRNDSPDDLVLVIGKQMVGKHCS